MTVAQKTAATILLAQSENNFFTHISDPYRTEIFELEMQSEDYVSKGDWRWIHNIKVYFRETLIIQLSFQKKLIDLPYTSNRISAYWLFKNTQSELREVLYNSLAKAG